MAAASALAAYACQAAQVGASPAGPSGPSGGAFTVVVSPSSVTLDSGRTLRLTADVRRADGSAAAATPVAWSSSAEAVATVGADGTVTAVAGGTATIAASAGGATSSASVTVRDVYDLDARGVPPLIAADYLDLSSIDRVSRFRSSAGHDYSDSAERCRSMKHYFMPRAGVDWSALAIASPADGTVVDLRPETSFGTQVQIRSAAIGAATIVIFHVVPDAGVSVGSRVAAGQRIGRHVGSQTMSDIAIRIETPSGSRLVSYFDAMGDALFAAYQARGVAGRGALVISRSERDADSLTCTGEQFAGGGSLAAWVALQ
jgi:hypothetical protein